MRSRWATLVGAIASVVPAAARAEAPLVEPTFVAVPARAALGSAVEVTYTWTTAAAFKAPGRGYRAVLQVRDDHDALLFSDDHAPQPAPETWRPDRTYTYRRTFFVPVYPYIGPASVFLDLLPPADDATGVQAVTARFKVATLELLPQVENIFVVYKDGWHTPEITPGRPDLERTWTKREAVATFKNPRKDLVIYLEADTDAKAFARPPVLTLTVGQRRVATIPIKDSHLFLEKVNVGTAVLGDAEWVDLHISMNGSFTRPGEPEPRELGLRVSHLYVGEASRYAGAPSPSPHR